MDEVGFAESFRPSSPVSVQDVLRRQLATPDRAELEQAAAERAAADALAERRETTAMLNRMQGDPIGNVSRAQLAVASLRDEEADLTAKLDAVRGRLRQAAEALVDWSATADDVLSATAQRSHTPDLLAPAREALTDHQIRQMAAVRSQAPGRRPFGHGGHARRSEVTCHECLKVGASAEESWLIHNDPCPPEVPDFPSEAELDMFGQRGQGHAQAVISR
jgi:hypothetical protein